MVVAIILFINFLFIQNTISVDTLRLNHVPNLHDISKQNYINTQDKNNTHPAGAFHNIERNINHLHGIVKRSVTKNKNVPTTKDGILKVFDSSTKDGDFIFLGGGDDNEGEDDNESGDDESGDNQQGSGDRENSFKPTITTRFTPIKRTTKRKNINSPQPTKKVTTIASLTSTKSTLTTTTIENQEDIQNQFIDIEYYGPCLFCKTRMAEDFLEELFIKNLKTYDFMFIVKKHPSGVYSSILSLNTKGNIKFSNFNYARIATPLTCDCFVKAPNKRYLLAGRIVNNRYFLNSMVPLLEIKTFEQLQRYVLK